MYKGDGKRRERDLEAVGGELDASENTLCLSIDKAYNNTLFFRVFSFS